jgi:protein-tyrosine phosphatase/endonuclease/exonuclease/phosphatase family metal-dependent hydrolase
MDHKTSDSNPIEIAEIHLNPNQKIGLSICPGKYQPTARSGPWCRSLDKDLDDIKNDGYDTILTLIEPCEIEKLKVQGFLNGEVEKRDMNWIWVPIIDGKTPTNANGLGLMEILAQVTNGNSVFVHCKGGLGRAGTVVAWLLTHFGRNSTEAIREVRQVRKNGAIENLDQEDWIHAYCGISLPSQISILALNVYNPQLSSWKLEKISQLLEKSKADFIVLTECGFAAFEKICNDLNARDGAHAPADFWGNGIISRYSQILSCDKIELPNYGEIRSACFTKIRLNHLHSIELIGSHLEVSSEGARLEQIEHLYKNRGLSKSMLVGDFNSLCQSDYEEESLFELEQIRHTGGKKPPRWDVMRCLLDKHQMIDSAKDTVFQPTTHYSSRVDYILCGQKSGLKPTPNTYRVIECIKSGISDHQAVMCTFDVV